MRGGVERGGRDDLGIDGDVAAGVPDFGVADAQGVETAAAVAGAVSASDDGVPEVGAVLEAGAEHDVSVSAQEPVVPPLRLDHVREVGDVDLLHVVLG
ncbi:hypothetical protein [Streptomyces sp. WZ-12]|uniref:hypothetical protein n=1 Tax=Streptomyces sp. WZ-12 TaxID=3030210 RepID=UPI0023816BC1|nr:hypothetical protein [Streptomyces sp. WZ-12]